ncbi:Rsm22-domain-containing protein [Daedalea quercina L-15889]|uniref:Rsm22-domain-containing protein n=1 Tax=Daedalea quercina L-15889 TaxID=1314783 RepID=A0A165T4X4_9APHY|nr:Rsm22-domain-containing protein [Daedalea quercina L-15889]
MLRSRCCRSLTAVLRRPVDAVYFSSSACSSSHQPNAPLDLDPSFHAVLKDVEMSLLRQKSRHASAANPAARVHRELEVYSQTEALEDVAPDVDPYDSHAEAFEAKDGRKSPAAAFGSQRIRSVVLPLELQNRIDCLIAESDKPRLHEDATRLFAQEADDGDEPLWNASYSAQYKSAMKARLHGERDGTAFASIALPSHYSVIYAVLNHVKQRLGPEWTVDRVIDWGSGTGTGLWALSHLFQQGGIDTAEGRMNAVLGQSTMTGYLGIDNREGLVSIGKRLVKDLELGGMNISWQKSFRNENVIGRSEGKNALALSAFLLSSLPTPLAKKTLVKQMWESGAEVMVLIDHNTTSGFESIAEAREYLLKLGRKELEDPELDGSIVRGSHIIAPCPHDGACPLYTPGSTKLVCSFSQRLQRPGFVRKTKHSGAGHEDSGYSYVVIRRGTRPVQQGTKVGRLGYVGKVAAAKAVLKQEPVKELVIEHDCSKHTAVEAEDVIPPQAEDLSVLDAVELAEKDTQEALQLEAYSWPRLVFPPLKKSGHIILDGCTAEGKIMRMTIPKSQGKQPFYDARKSSWGDIFPHEPKNRPQERFQPANATEPSKGRDIGKRKKSSRQAASYDKISRELKQDRRERAESGRARRRTNRMADDL